MKRVIYISLFVASLTLSSLADIARPTETPKTKNPRAVSSSMTIRLDPKASEAKLLIPKSQLAQLRAELDAATDDTATAGTFMQTQTIVSGLFLSLAFVFGGIWLIRPSKPTIGVRAAALVVIFGGIAATANLVLANVGPPPAARSITSKLFDRKLFTPYRFASGKITIEGSNANAIELIVPDLPESTPADE